MTNEILLLVVIAALTVYAAVIARAHAKLLTQYNELSQRYVNLAEKTNRE